MREEKEQPVCVKIWCNTFILEAELAAVCSIKMPLQALTAFVSKLGERILSCQMPVAAQPCLRWDWKEYVVTFK